MISTASSGKSVRRVARTVLGLAIAQAVAFAVSAQTRSEEGFQGLRWGASEREIEQRFKGQVTRAKCDLALAIASKEFKAKCDSYRIDPYEIAGIPFVLAFDQAASDSTLRAVYLRFREEVTGRSRIKDRREALGYYNAVLSLLRERYGDEKENGVGSPSGILVAKSVWRTRTTRIDLDLMYVDKAGQESYVELKVHYSPLLSRSAGKL